MALNFIFVHGTGVRQPDYDKTLALINKQLQKQDTSALCYPCYWGGEYGSKLNAGGVSIPTEKAASRGIGFESLAGEEYDFKLWNLLYQDPLFELEVLASQAQENGFTPGSISVGANLQQNLRAFSPSPELIEGLEEAKITQEILQEAQKTLVEEPTLSRILETAIPESLAEYQKAIAKALLAQSVILLSQKEGFAALSLTGEGRDRLVSQIYEELGGNTSRGILDGRENLVKRAFSPLLTGISKKPLDMLTNLGVRKREEWSEAYAANVGDILLYQTRGQGIRNYIRQTVDKLKSSSEQIVLLAHSLGGIAAVDVLLEKEPPAVAHLITIGSQSPIFYEWNTLIGMTFQPGARLPETFPRWLNIYDDKDFLSYIGEPLFPEQIEDYEVSNGQPFPASHGAYWNNAQVWEKIFTWL